MSNEQDAHWFVLGWLDMLGWRDLPLDREESIKAVNFRHALMERFRHILWYPGLQVPPLKSGSVVVSLDEKNADAVVVHLCMQQMDLGPMENFFHVFEAVTLLMFQSGFLMRGALTADVWDTQVRAKARAESLEKHGAIYPRIMVDTLEDGRTPCFMIYDRRAELIGSPDKYEGLFLRDDVWSFDFLRYAGVFPRPKEMVLENTKYKISVVRPVVEAGLERFAPHKAKVFDAKAKDRHLKLWEKYKWYADYFDGVAAEVDEPPIDLSLPKFQ
jgi:hypothetical protein